MSTYVSKILAFGASPTAVPKILRAASKRLRRISNLAARVQILEKENAACGTSFRHSRYTSRARSWSFASSSSNSA